MLELDQAAHVVNEVHNADLCLFLCLRYTNRMDELAAHGALLKTEHMRDTNPDLRAVLVGFHLPRGEGLVVSALVMNMTAINRIVHNWLVSTCV